MWDGQPSCRLRSDCALALGRHGTVRADGLCRHVTLELLFDGVERSIEQSYKQCEFDQQGLFPAPDRAHRNGGRRFCGPPYQLSYFGIANGVVSVPARLAGDGPAGIHSLWVFRQHRPVAVDHRPQRQVPGFPICHPFHRAVRPLHFAGRL